MTNNKKRINEDLVSVIMPTYNSSRFVAESIESILHQTYSNIELLITDDGSTDNTTEIINYYAKKDKRVKCFLLSENMGAGHARNYSIQKANGRYIAFCDSDDIWMTDKLEKQIAYMQEKKCSFCFSSYFVCDETGTQTSIVLAPHSVSLADTKRDDKIGFLTAVYDTYAYGKFYMPTLRKRQDWAYVLLILQKCKRAFALREPLAYYRKSKGSISSNKLSLIKFNAKVYETVFGYSTFLAYFYLFSLFLPSYFLKRVNHKFTNIYYRKTLSAQTSGRITQTNKMSPIYKTKH